MLSFDDTRWTQMQGGYRLPYDPRPVLLKLESGSGTAEAWDELWQELYHQGAVGEASYAAVPHLVRIHRDRRNADWQTYAMVVAIELARDHERNPRVPDWLEEGYDSAIAELARLGMIELPRIEDKETVRGILALLALWKSARVYSHILIDFSEAEILELEAWAAAGNQ
jgi:hypothetical protein